MTIVLKTRGKHESVDYASVHSFPTEQDAHKFCHAVNTGKQKHWVKAEIVDDGEEIELAQPDE